METKCETRSKESNYIDVDVEFITTTHRTGRCVVAPVVSASSMCVAVAGAPCWPALPAGRRSLCRDTFPDLCKAATTTTTAGGWAASIGALPSPTLSTWFQRSQPGPPRRGWNAARSRSSGVPFRALSARHLETKRGAHLSRRRLLRLLRHLQLPASPQDRAALC